MVDIDGQIGQTFPTIKIYIFHQFQQFLSECLVCFIVSYKLNVMLSQYQLWESICGFPFVAVELDQFTEGFAELFSN